jgi:hypothetical protein
MNNEFQTIGQQLGYSYYDYPLRIYDDQNKLIYYEDDIDWVFYYRDDNNSMDILCGIVKL